ncbi:MAG: cobyrinate a,c-diamide synthase [Treponemataceae bacterium]|nr:cobyrinate a,c-diamide synthase [Treponemataceae bacterium]
MRFPRIVIAAPKSGSGKTLVSIALMKALSIRGKKVSAFKCGPDYIDPLFHKKILDVPSKNLDLFFSDPVTIHHLFADDNSSDISIIEGVMGLFDGVAGFTDEASTYHLASVLESPVILVVNAKGAGRSIVAEIKGFVSMDEKKLIKGVILNNLPGTLYDALKPQIEGECSILVLGFLPTLGELHVESRYLGLTLPDEIADIRLSVEKVAEKLCETVDVEKIVDIAENAPDLEARIEGTQTKAAPDDAHRVRIAVARDEAFCFYYDDNLKLLEQYGAEIVTFSPIADNSLPPGIDGIVFGGGYPELHAEKLEQNVSMRRAVKAAIESGMPSVAECGGFMYLHERIQTAEGVFRNMVGLINGDCTYKGKAVRFGYCTVTENTGDFFGGSIKAHEFHYFDSTCNGESCTAEKPVTGKSWLCCHIGENHWWGFPHLYYPSNPLFAERFVEMCREYKNRPGKSKNYKFFQNRACEMFPCHQTDDPDNFNCLFCFCPLYFSGEKCGGNFKFTEKGTKSCINCTFPHKKENYDALMAKLRMFLKKNDK